MSQPELPVAQQQPTQTQDPRKGWTSASAAEADLLCPGRHIAQRGLPEETSEDASRGTKIHAALATGNPDGLSIEETEIFEACHKIEEAVLLKAFGPVPEGSRWKPVVETRFWLKNAQGLMHSGQPDKVYRKGTRALIVDYKTGSGDVAVSPRNQQLRDLAVLVSKSTTLLNDVAVAVIQPLSTFDPELCIYGKEDLHRAAVELEARIKASNDTKSKRVAGEVQCKYCRARASCLEYQQWAASPLPVARPLLDVPSTQWTPEQWAVFCEGEPIAAKWLEDRKAEAKKLLEQNPQAIPGWTLKPGANRETIINAQECFDRFSKAGGSLEQFMGTISVTKGKLREELGKATGTKGKALDASLKTLTDGIVEVKQNAPSIVRELKPK